jgi:2,4-dienoyl-CoA reductase-like NADH-dependent reductase (Old Yellow Enzyme family)
MSTLLSGFGNWRCGTANHETPIAALAGHAVIHHFRKIYRGQVILNVGITPEQANDLISAGLGDFVAFGRKYIANPDLVERIRLHAPLNEQRPEGYYGEAAFGYTDYLFLLGECRSALGSDGMKEHCHA